MKKMIVMACLAGAISLSTVQAQTVPSRENEGVHKEAGSKDGKEMLDELNLSGAQKKKMKALRQESHKQLESIKSDTTLSEEEKKVKMKALRQKQETEINALLTPEQKVKWEEYKKNKDGRKKDKDFKE